MKLDTLLEGSGVKELLMHVQQELIEKHDLDPKIEHYGGVFELSFTLEPDKSCPIDISIKIHEADRYTTIESKSSKLGDLFRVLHTAIKDTPLTLLTIMDGIEEIDDRNCASYKRMQASGQV